MERDIGTLWTSALSAGGCMTCSSRADVLKINAKGVEIRFCAACFALIKKGAGRR